MRWWAGVTVDHLYEDCPSRARAEATLRAWDEWDMCSEGIDPLGTDVCGLCRRRWIREQVTV